MTCGDNKMSSEDRTVTINIELAAHEITGLKQITKLENDAEAVVKAAREFLRLARLRELKAVSGKFEFDTNEQRLEELELVESSFPE